MFEAGGSAQDVELVTRAGHVIKVKPARSTCIVYMDNEPEVVQLAGGRSTMDQVVPFVVFLGEDFQLRLDPGHVELVDSRRGRVAIPYALGGGPDRFISISCHSRVDQFPVQVQHYPSVKQFMAREGEGHPYRYMVLDQNISRIDMVTLKVKNPDARILILREEVRQEVKPKPRASELAPDRVRATDLAGGGGGSEFSNNPVFNARVHLRNLHLDRVKNLLNEFDMSVEEIEFIRTFLGIMIKNDQQKSELAEFEAELRRIDELYRLSARIVARDQDGFEQELEQGIDPVVAEDLGRLIARKRAAASNKEEEIQYWEWEYRLTREES